MEETFFSDLNADNCESGKTAVWDRNGKRHILCTPPWKISEEERESNVIPLHPLAEGGQGVIYMTADPKVILKFAKNNAKIVTEETEIQAFNEKIQYISGLPVPEKCNITLPETLLANYAGYRMTFLGNMRSFNDTFINFIPEEQAPDYLPEGKIYKGCWRYLQSGGLKRRLEALGRLAAELAKLHSHGIVYCDISYDNIFISEDHNENVIYLIDPDNLRG